ncbi:response regulator [Mucilaginibacter sp.]|jgi:DNA-binding response OmpR family regulator|uniref:response regulator n=1 Tax=Mucilaginibacter sp. TaxID=1882438 RepID=UPI00356A520E
METIMIQEPDAAILKRLTAALEMEGFRVYSLTDYKENILEMIRRHRPKLVLLDRRFSNYSGKQISHWIKAHFPRLPLIAFGCDNPIDQEYDRYGFDDYVKKPFDLNAFYQVIKRYLPKRRKMT